MRDKQSQRKAHTIQERHEGKSENSNDLLLCQTVQAHISVNGWVNFDVLAVRELFLRAPGGHPAAHQIKLMES